MSIVVVPERAIALKIDCPRCHVPAGVACTRSGGSVITAIDGHSRGGTLYVCAERLHPSLECDFCGLPGTTARVIWTAPCRDFDRGYPALVEGGPQAFSRGAWAACQQCGELVSLAKRRQLAERAFAHIYARVVAEDGERIARRVRAQLRAAIRDQQDLFWRNREGPIRLITPAEIRDSAVQVDGEVAEIPNVTPRVAPWWEAVRQQ